MFAWQATVQDENGSAVPLPVVTVWESDGTTLAEIFDEAGAALPNPLTGTLDGFVQFWASAGEYSVYGSSGSDSTENWRVYLGPSHVSPESFWSPIEPDYTLAMGRFLTYLQDHPDTVGVMRGRYHIADDYILTSPIKLDATGSTVVQNAPLRGFLHLRADGNQVFGVTVVAALDLVQPITSQRYRGYTVYQRCCAIWLEGGRSKIRNIHAEGMFNTLCLRGPVEWYPSGAGYTGADTDPNTAFDYSSHVEDNDVFAITGKSQDFAITGHQQRNLTLIKYGISDVTKTTDAPPHGIYMRSNGTGPTAGSMIGGLISQGSVYASPDGVGHKFHDCYGTSFADLVAYDASGVSNFIDCVDCSWANLNGSNLAGDNSMPRFAHYMEGCTGYYDILNMTGVEANTIGLLEISDGKIPSDIVVNGWAAKTDFRTGNGVTESLIRVSGQSKLTIRGGDYEALGDDPRYMFVTTDAATIIAADFACTGVTNLANAAGGSIHLNYDAVQLQGAPIGNSGTVTTTVDERTKSFDHGAAISMYGTTTPGSTNYTIRRCFIERVGSRVTASIVLQLNGAFGGTGDVRIGPLPYAISMGAGVPTIDEGRIITRGSGVTLAAGAFLVAALVDGENFVRLQTLTGLTRANVAHTSILSGAVLEFSLEYHTTDPF